MSAFALTSAIGSVKVAARKSPVSHGRRTSVVVRAGLTVKDLKPTGNRVLVLPDAPETKTAGGILLSTSETNSGPGSSICEVAERSMRSLFFGEVASVGGDVTTVKAGDKVLINGFAGSDVVFEDGNKGKFITVDDVIAIVSA